MEKSVAWIDDVKRLTVNADQIHALTGCIPVVKSGGEELEGKVEETHLDHTASIIFKSSLPIGGEAVLHWGDQQFPVYAGSVVRTAWFEKHFTDTQETYGAEWGKDGTFFKVWVPTASKVKLYLNNTYYEMKKSKKGVWSVFVEEDLHLTAYQYEAAINGKLIKVNDPYAKALSVNSKKSVVIDMARAEPEGFFTHRQPEFDKPEDAIIYELHVRDATIDEKSGVVNKGKFKGLTETGTVTGQNELTGLSYFKELGITHVQLLPVNDFGRVDDLNPDKQYNWGYDPLFFQVPEGSYATEPEDPLSRIRELREMIGSFHENGLNVILDVVYNHVFIKEESPFHQLVPGYYFRYHGDGTPGNGTGVGNDLATERVMVRKFILDSISWWLQQYRADGFRFDLMGAMDVETMKQIRALCDKEDKTVILLGEGWHLDTPLAHDRKATMEQAGELNGIAFFNDYFRDTMKGSLFLKHDAGFVNGHGHFIERLPQLVSGSCRDDMPGRIVSSAAQSVNYVECHDNHTLWDRLFLTNESETDEEKKKIHQLATGLTLLSQGIPFLHAGQEWFRTKQGDENSYISNDRINKLDWTRRTEQRDNILYVKSLIDLRKHYPVFRMTRQEEIKRRLHILQCPAPVFGWLLLGADVEISVFVNPTKRRYPLYLPSPGKWDKLISNRLPVLTSASFVIGDQGEIEPYELIVLKKDRVQ
ncbi:type I pullulanase [Alteribacter lacisalsi]|uniref:Type I pullulanase n=1 Tax=Alteribacter lacisalsi TaxID=2045244 RepID=A0A2W0H881_9BACI|nr:type I pullulanase [Alteribacter lacisalsi]PYZ97151.1 type I pullulanase [Alteribacter lacisalsi]